MAKIYTVIVIGMVLSLLQQVFSHKDNNNPPLEMANEELLNTL